MPGIVEGHKWVQARLRFLEELKAGDLSDEQRQAVEAEIATLKQQSSGRWWRFLWPRLPHRPDL